MNFNQADPTLQFESIAFHILINLNWNLDQCVKTTRLGRLLLSFCVSLLPGVDLAWITHK